MRPAGAAWGLMLATALLLGAAVGCESEPLVDDPSPAGGAGAENEPNELTGYTKSGGEIACGSERCVVGEEACCWPRSGLLNGFCVSVANLTSDAELQAACSAIDPEVGRALTCQGMSDCVEGATCCTEQEVIARCVPAETPGENPCFYQESCRSGEQCFGAQTECLDYFDEHVCVTTGQTVSCGDTECSGDTPTCCYAPEASPSQFCRAPVDCQPVDGTRYGCTAPDDCAPGYVCCGIRGGGGTLCRGECPYVVCSSDDDCPASAPSCLEDDEFMPGVKVCN